MSEEVATLNRTTFKLSREIEFFTEKELEMQIGHSKDFWYVALIKELIDNALDACEVGSISPSIEIVIQDDFFEIRDNGPGLKPETVTGSLNYLIRVSDKQFYVSPTRGQMGNALKAVWAAPYVAFGHGLAEIDACGVHHTIETDLDRILQKPEIRHSQAEGPVKIGTIVRIHWPKLSGKEEPEDGYFYKAKPPSIEDLIRGYAAFNPHAGFRLNETIYKATDPAWTKWRTDMPTCPHWYTEYTLRDLIAAYVADERQDGQKSKTVREFVSEFRGLSATAKQKRVTEGFKAMHLKDLIVQNDIAMDTVRDLLARMKENSKPVNPHSLGMVGEEHFKKWIGQYEIIDQSFRYKGIANSQELPYAVEVGFAVKKDTEASRTLVTGMNWSPTLGIPAREISDAIQKARVDAQDPVVLIIHLIRPRFEFTDRGKTRVAL